MKKFRVEPCSLVAAKYAVEKWHYSHKWPGGRCALYGVWEESAFIGAVIFGYGALGLGAPYGLTTGAVVELRRVALDKHETPVSQIVARAIKRLKVDSPGVRLIMSFADTAQGHHGGIYQAGNWVYLGVTSNDAHYIVRGKRYHRRGLHDLWVSAGKPMLGNKSVYDWVRSTLDAKATRVHDLPKHRYAMPLDRPMRRKLNAMAQPYPLRTKC